MKYLILLSVFLLMLACEKNQTTKQNSVSENPIVLKESCRNACRDPEHARKAIDLLKLYYPEHNVFSSDIGDPNLLVKDPIFFDFCMQNCLIRVRN